MFEYQLNTNLFKVKNKKEAKKNKPYDVTYLLLRTSDSYKKAEGG